MKTIFASLVVALGMLGGLGTAAAADLKDKVKVETASVGLHPGMDPGMYVCAANHLHIKGTVQNMADVALGRIKVAGKAFDAGGKLLGTATGSTKQAILARGDRAEVDLEFLTLTGPQIQQVKKHELTVIEAPAKR